MKKTYESLKMPKKFMVINEKEMEFIDGGSVSLPMNNTYLNKATCLSKAQELINNGQVTGMTTNAIAQEIYAHAACYYEADYIKSLGISSSVLNYLTSHASMVDIADGGDTLSRRIAYSVIWASYNGTN